MSDKLESEIRQEAQAKQEEEWVSASFSNESEQSRVFKKSLSNPPIPLNIKGISDENEKINSEEERKEKWPNQLKN